MKWNINILTSQLLILIVAMLSLWWNQPALVVPFHCN